MQIQYQTGRKLTLYMQMKKSKNLQKEYHILNTTYVYTYMIQDKKKTYSGKISQQD